MRMNSYFQMKERAPGLTPGKKNAKRQEEGKQ